MTDVPRWMATGSVLRRYRQGRRVVAVGTVCNERAEMYGTYGRQSHN